MQKNMRFQVREIIGKLIKKCGFEVVQSMLPESMYKMVHNMMKSQAREKRQWEARRDSKKDQEEEEEGGEKEDTGPFKFKSQSIEELLEDSDSEPEAEEVKKERVKGRRKGQSWIQEDAEQEIVDLMDSKVSQKITTVKPDQGTSTQRKEIQHGFKMTDDGKLIITEDDKEEEEVLRKLKGIAVRGAAPKTTPALSGGEPSVSEIMAAIAGPSKLNKISKKRKHNDDDDEMDPSANKYVAGGQGIHRPVKKGKQQTKDYGSEYRATKAGGDMKKKGKPDPFAYIPFNYQALNKRKRAKFTGQFNNIVRAARKGAVVGIKNKAKNERRRK
jgi:ribosomal RNA-processing protein 12